MKARLYEKYVNEVKPALKEKRGYTNDPSDSEAGKDRREHGRERVAGKGRDGRRREGSDD